MKRHAEQRAREGVLRETMEQHKITRILTPFLDSWLRFPNDLAVVLCVKRADGEQHNYAIKLESEEVRAMGLGEQDRDREFMPDVRYKEEEVRRLRQKAVDYLAQKMAVAMMNYLEKNDPQFGYSPKEWEGMK